MPGIFVGWGRFVKMKRGINALVLCAMLIAYVNTAVIENQHFGLQVTDLPNTANAGTCVNCVSSLSTRTDFPRSHTPHSH